jgi:hypothetical protein
MKVTDNLTKEIARRILGDLGIVSHPNFGKRGITEKDFKSNKTIVAIHNDIEVTHSVFAGKISFSETSFLRALLLDLSLEKIENSFILLLQKDKNPIYAISFTATEKEEKCLFFLSSGSGWKPASILIQSQALVGIESITDQGLSWSPCEEIDDLYQVSLSLIDE